MTFEKPEIKSQVHHYSEPLMLSRSSKDLKYKGLYALSIKSLVFNLYLHGMYPVFIIHHLRFNFVLLCLAVFEEFLGYLWEKCI